MSIVLCSRALYIPPCPERPKLKKTGFRLEPRAPKGRLSSAGRCNVFPTRQFDIYLAPPLNNYQSERVPVCIPILLRLLI